MLKFYYSLLRNIIFKEYNFLRLTPWHKGWIYFYSRRNSVFFRVRSQDKTSSLTADQIFTNHEYDLKFLKTYNLLTERFNGILKGNKQPLIIDCGANMGYSAIYFNLFFPKAKVYAVEPSKNNFGLLEENVIKFNNIFTFRAAIGQKLGHCKIHDEEVSNNAFRTEPVDLDYTGEVIDVIDMPSLFKRDVNTIPFIIKIDIEGFEEELFKDNFQWIDEVPLIVIELHDWLFMNSGNSQNFLKAISKYKRDFVIKGENVYSIKTNLNNSEIL